jgi:hypothetical protein
VTGELLVVQWVRTARREVSGLVRHGR